MPAYRAYLLDHENQIAKSKELECRNDEEALGRALQLVEGQGVEPWGGNVELWEHSRLIVRIDLRSMATDRAEGH